jgi:predicted Co/Zn/Cd cation transporter (cation efflux family)
VIYTVDLISLIAGVVLGILVVFALVGAIHSIGSGGSS